MRLKKFLNEMKQLTLPGFPDFDSKIDKIIRDTKPWINFCNRNRCDNKFLYRGSDHIVRNFKKKRTRSNRSPKDMCSNVHELFNEFFMSKFGVYARTESVFCFPNEKGTGTYGDSTYVVMPIGKKFDILWNPHHNKEYYNNHLHLHNCINLVYEDSIKYQIFYLLALLHIQDLYNYVDGDDYYNTLCYDEESILEEWEYEYGEGTGNGEYEYDGQSTGATDESEVEEWVEKELGEEFDYSKMEWIPEVDLSDFVDQKFSEAQRELGSIVNDYEKNKKIKQLMDNRKYIENEVMLCCDYYYLFDKEFAEEIFLGKHL